MEGYPLRKISVSTRCFVALCFKHVQYEGDRQERQRIELKAENKRFVPHLVSLKMSEASLHGNDAKQVSYDVYVLIPESAIDESMFSNSWLVRRRATVKEAQWLSPSEWVVPSIQPGSATSPTTMSIEKRAVHLLAGESVPQVLLESLLLTSHPPGFNP